MLPKRLTDSVKHSVLFSKLVRRGVAGYIVRLLCYWYDRQAMCVRWGIRPGVVIALSNWATGIITCLREV